MKSTRTSLVAIMAGILAVLGGWAVTAQDKYTLRIPDGLAFSEFKGYETWQVVSLSHSDETLDVIVANPVMVEAYAAGIPGNGKPFPDGAKTAKIQYIPKKSSEAPFGVAIPDRLKDVAFMLKDSKRFSTSGGWGYGDVQPRHRVRQVHPRWEGCELRVRVPHESEGERLRLHGVREEVDEPVPGARAVTLRGHGFARPAHLTAFTSSVLNASRSCTRWSWPSVMPTMRAVG